ncbi:MAG: hypothetical protein JSR15_10120 [Proteobacteria bacterium]|nr:hypothetical protein [Pseudomonadota bacterium]
MKSTTTLTTMAAIAFATTLAAQGAAPGGGTGGPSTGGGGAGTRAGQSMQMPRAGDRDRKHDWDRRRDQDRDRIYASDLMTAEERTQHWDKLRSMKTEEERIQYRLEQQKIMQQRAKDRGLKAPAPLSRARIAEQERDRQQERRSVYGYELMSQAELEQHRERLREAKTAQERESIRAEHHAQMEARAREQGVTLAPQAGKPK